MTQISGRPVMYKKGDFDTPLPDHDLVCLIQNILRVQQIEILRFYVERRPRALATVPS